MYFILTNLGLISGMQKWINIRILINQQTKREKKSDYLSKCQKAIKTIQHGD